MPTPDIIEACANYCNHDTGELSVPLTVRISQQTLPVCGVSLQPPHSCLQLTLTIVAVVTSSSIACDAAALDFGLVSIFESAVKTIRLTNTSVLAQKYGFCDLPPHISVQPGDGFGTILPGETLSLDVIFRCVAPVTCHA